MEKLKPCPLCAKSSVVTDAICGLWYVTCLSCDCKSGEYEIESEAIAAWNTRPGEDKLQDRIDTLEWLVEVDEFCESSYYNDMSADGYDELYAIHLAALAAVEKNNGSKA